MGGMQSGAPVKRWTVLVVTQARVFPVELVGGRPVVVGRGRGSGIDLADPKVSERHLSLAVREDGVVVELLREAGEAQVNDVQLSGPTVLRSGDEVKLGGCRLMVLSALPPAPRAPRVASHDELLARLDEELRRADSRRPVGLALVAMPALNAPARQALTRRVVDEVAKSGAVACWGELTNDLLAAVVPELSREALLGVFERLPQVAGQRAKVVTALSPRDGLDAEALLEAALERLLGADPDEELVLEDPLMVRLLELTDSLAERGGTVLVAGPTGAGRATLLKRLARTAGLSLEVVHARDAEAVEAALAAKGGALLLREVSGLSRAALDSALERASARGRRVLATCANTLHASAFDAALEVPPLASRPDDVLPLAEHFLAVARVALGRPKLVLGHDARQLITGYSWPGNVRELRNVMVRAARASVRDEVGRDALPSRMAAGMSAEGLRSAMVSAERDLLLEALARTRWNVTAAATRLGLPRRTVVYRMARLGLRRPAR